jgi:hypothetical protein
MTKPVTLNRLLSVLEHTFAQLPDKRKGKNTTYSMSDAAMAAFSVLFMQSPSFLAHQEAMQGRERRNNAASLFGIEKIPSEPQILPTLPDAVWINPPKGDNKPSTDVLTVSDLKPVQVKLTANNGSDTFGHQADLAYTDTAGAEDRACPECSEGATLRSDPSADAGDGVAGQGLTGPAHNGQTNQLHCQKSDKPKTLAAASLALVAASPHHRRAGPASTQHSYTKLSLALSHNS